MKDSKKQNETQEFQVQFIRPYKIRSSKNKKGTKNLMIYLNGSTIISLNENFIKAVFANINKKPQS